MEKRSFFYSKHTFGGKIRRAYRKEIVQKMSTESGEMLKKETRPLLWGRVSFSHAVGCLFSTRFTRCFPNRWSARRPCRG